MNPAPDKTPLERAEELDVAAKIATDNQDHAFASECRCHARHLRAQAQQQEKEAQP